MEKEAVDFAGMCAEFVVEMDHLVVGAILAQFCTRGLFFFFFSHA